jgi:hypothetical protein
MCFLLMLYSPSNDWRDASPSLPNVREADQVPGRCDTASVEKRLPENLSMASEDCGAFNAISAEPLDFATKYAVGWFRLLAIMRPLIGRGEPQRHSCVFLELGWPHEGRCQNRSVLPLKENHPMSAPRTNLEKQKRRHIVPLLGMALVVLFGVGLIIFWQAEEASQGRGPGDDRPTVPGTEREVVPPMEDQPAPAE